MDETLGTNGTSRSCFRNFSRDSSRNPSNTTPEIQQVETMGILSEISSGFSLQISLRIFPEVHKKCLQDCSRHSDIYPEVHWGISPELQSRVLLRMLSGMLEDSSTNSFLYEFLNRSHLTGGNGSDFGQCVIYSAVFSRKTSTNSFWKLCLQTFLPKLLLRNFSRDIITETFRITLKVSFRNLEDWSRSKYFSRNSSTG